MKLIFKIIIAIALIFSIPNVQIYAEISKTVARQSLDDALTPFFAGTTGWKSEVFSEKLKQTIKVYPSSKEALTAKLFYAEHLQALDQAENLIEEQRLYREIMATATGSWQASLAWLHLTATYGMQGNYQLMLVSARDGLTNIDFTALEKSNDPDFQRLLAFYATPASNIREAFKVLFAKAHAKTGNLPEAENILNTVQDQNLKKGLTSGIEYQKKQQKQRESLPPQ